MAITKILVPYDKSDHAKEALAEAIKVIGDNPNATIHVLEVQAPPHDLVFSAMNPQEFGSHKPVVEKETFLENVNERAAAATEALQAEVLPQTEGFPGKVIAETVFAIYVVDTIVDAAKSDEADMIAMGSRGIGAIRGMIGSISYGVLRAATVPVLVVH